MHCECNMDRITHLNDEKDIVGSDSSVWLLSGRATKRLRSTSKGVATTRAMSCATTRRPPSEKIGTARVGSRIVTLSSRSILDTRLNVWAANDQNQKRSRPTKFQIETLRPGLCWQTKFETCVKYFTGRSALRAMNTTSLLKSSTYARSNLEQLIMIESAWTIAPRRHGVVILRLPLTVTAPNSSGEACQTSAKSFSGWVWGILHQTKLCAINGQLAPSCFKILRNQSNSRYIWLNQIQKSHNKLIQHHGWMWIFNSSKRLRLEWTKCPDDTLSLSSETKPPKSNYWYFTPQEWLKASHHTAIYCIFYISRKTITVTITTSMNWE